MMFMVPIKVRTNDVFGLRRGKGEVGNTYVATTCEYFDKGRSCRCFKISPQNLLTRSFHAAHQPQELITH